MAQDSSIPTTSDVEGIYAIADRLLLDSLMSKALHFLESTCSLQNITARAFGPFSASHDAVERLYDNYFIENWNKVIQTVEFESFFTDLEHDATEYIRVNTKLRMMMRSRKRKLDNQVLTPPGRDTKPDPPGWDTMKLYMSFLCVYIFTVLLSFARERYKVQDWRQNFCQFTGRIRQYREDDY